MASAEAHPTKEAATKRRTGSGGRKKWSAGVMRRSNALDLEAGIFKSRNPERIALSLKRSAERSKRKKGTSYQSAMSMLNFYINRAGRNLSPNRKRILERSREKLREAFGK